MTEKTSINRLKNLFGINYKSKVDNVSDGYVALKPLEKNDQGKVDYDRVLKKSPFSSDVKHLLDYWANSCHDNAESWKNRQQLYTDMEMLYYNSPLMARAITLIADEVVQADSNNTPIFIEGKRKVKKELQKLFDDIHLYDFIHPTAIDIVQHGNAIWLLNLEEDGVKSIKPLGVNELNERLEFTPYEVKNLIDKEDVNFSKLRGIDRLDQLANFVKDKENIASMYDSYLFGFVVGDHAIPPWRCLHFRNLTTKSPFKPYGIPMFIHSLSSYRQLDAAMSYQVVARSLRFPKDHYKLAAPIGAEPTEQLHLAIEFLNELQNSGIGTSNKEKSALNDTIISIEGLFDYVQESPDIDIGKVDDLQMLKDDLINSTFLPRYLLDPNDGGFGDSGVSLIQKWKPFARLVYRVQNIILQNVTQLCKIHLLHNTNFTTDDMDFILSMPFPESQVDRDIIDNQRDLMELANDIIDNISEKIMDGGEVPLTLIQDIYNQFLPYDDARIDSWIKQAKKAMPSEEEGVDQEESSIRYKIARDREIFIESTKKWKLLEKKLNKTNLKESVDEIILENKQQSMREGVMAKKHFYSSMNKYIDFPIELLRDLDMSRIKKLAESGKDKTNVNNEEVPYTFVSKVEAKPLVEEYDKHGRSKYKFIFGKDTKTGNKE